MQKSPSLKYAVCSHSLHRYRYRHVDIKLGRSVNKDSDTDNDNDKGCAMAIGYHCTNNRKEKQKVDRDLLQEHEIL